MTYCSAVKPLMVLGIEPLSWLLYKSKYLHIHPGHAAHSITRTTVPSTPVECEDSELDTDKSIAITRCRYYVVMAAMLPNQLHHTNRARKY